MLTEVKENITRERLIKAIQNHCSGQDDCGLCPLNNLCCADGDLWAIAEGREPMNQPDNEMLAEAFARIAFRNANKNGGSAADATHYQALSMQPIEIMQQLMTREEFLGFLWGNVIKYALRCGRKDEPAKEMEKVKQYAEWYVQAAAGETIDPRKAA